MSPPTPADAASAREAAHETAHVEGARRQRRKEARPQELLAAALDLFVEKGYAAARAEEVAQRAGVSKGTLYLYYPSKEELFKAVVRQNLSNVIAEARARADAFQGSSSDLLSELMETWWNRFGNTPAAGIHKVVVSEVRNFPELAQFYSDEVIRPATDLFGHCVARGIGSGEFRPLPLHEVVMSLMAPMLFLILHRHSLGACPIQGATVIEPINVLKTNLELILRGLEAGAARNAPGARP